MGDSVNLTDAKPAIRHYKPWKTSEIRRLMDLCGEGWGNAHIGLMLSRTTNSIEDKVLELRQKGITVPGRRPARGA